jgi:gluconate 5-dehydrogenase
VSTFAADLADAAAIPALVAAVLARHGAIDVLVNNAGATWGAPAVEYPAEAWHKVMNVNVHAPFFLTQEVGRRSMIPRGSGAVVNVSSVAGLRGNPPGMATIAYNASKAAGLGFTRALAAEWGPHGVRVNALCPGFFPSKMTRGLLERLEKAVVARTPLGRLGGDDDLKGAVVFLASEASRHVTGQYLVVDGGADATY